ncbi:hypothetical protein GGF40_003196 [Coemansia sp. RSA 1286]|nr:hypothetical protein GGF40_003196 [Coemansia sp. RSA 1286]
MQYNYQGHDNGYEEEQPFSYAPHEQSSGAQFNGGNNFYSQYIQTDNAFYQPQTSFYHYGYFGATEPESSTIANIASKVHSISHKASTNTGVVAIKKTGESKPRQTYRAKTPWTMEENKNLFKSMAEYIYVDKNGMKPLAMYLNPSEIDHVEKCEETMSDEEIGLSLRKAEIDNNPNRRGDLLFAFVRHLQAASGYHNTRVVNEKIKNVRSRIINLFMNMHVEGALPTKRPVRYIAAMVNSIVRSPFSTLEPSVKTLHTNSAYADNKHDVCLWLDAMYLLHTQNMHDFINQCAINLVRTHLELIATGLYADQVAMELAQEEPNMSFVVSCLNTLINVLNNDERVKKDKAKRGEEVLRKRKRKNTASSNSAQKRKIEDVQIVCNDNKTVSLALFEMLKNEEKLQIAGIPLKMIAAVGGTIRRRDPMTVLDIKYNLYRLWTCVSRFNDITAKLSNATVGRPDQDSFTEFVVVNHFAQSFSELAIEPRIRISKTRVADGDLKLDQLIEQYFASTENESRHHVPVWMTVCKRSDGQYVFALVITSANMIAPADIQISGSTSFRRFTDDSLFPIIDNALASGGSLPYAGVSMCQHAGLDTWPWTPDQLSTIVMSQGYEEQLDLVIEKGSRVMVSTGWPNTTHTLSPWAEPRVLNGEAYRFQQKYASVSMMDVAPSYEQLVEAQKALLEDTFTPAHTAANNSSSQSLGGNQMPSFIQQPQTPIQPLVNSYSSGMTHLVADNAGLLLANSPIMANPQQFSLDLLGTNDNSWTTGDGYNAASSPYPHLFQNNNSSSNPDYQPM